jgi:hypothetical protein
MPGPGKRQRKRGELRLKGLQLKKSGKLRRPIVAKAKSRLLRVRQKEILERERLILQSNMKRRGLRSIKPIKIL